MSFRPARRDDLEPIVALMRAYYAEDGYPFDEAHARRVLNELAHARDLGALWALTDGDAVVGYLAVTLGFSLEYRGRDAFVDELYIAASHRGRGLGRDAMQLAESWCRERGVRALHLEVETHRPVAHELYRRAGFAEHDRVLMTKWLRDPPN